MFANFSCIVGRMTTHLDWDRLGRFVRTARGPRAQRDITANGGPSDETLSKIEQGRWRPTRSVQKTLEKLEQGLGWAAGSANAVLNGGEPTPADAAPPPSTVSRPVTINLDKNNGDWLATVNDLLATGDLTDNQRATLESLRDDTLIERFPDVYEALSHGGKLQVAHFGQNIYRHEQEHSHANPSPDATQSDAPAEGDQGQEVTRLPHWDFATPPPPVELADAASRGEKASDFESDDS